jgi:hypothetical protein
MLRFFLFVVSKIAAAVSDAKKLPEALADQK